MLDSLNSVVGRVSGAITLFTGRRSKGEATDLVIDHELKGITPEMLDWWWDNINSTERYRLWHPQAHLAFKWEHKDDQHVGTIHKVTEKIGVFPTTLRIRWEDPNLVSIPRVYEHANLGSVLNKENQSISWLMHQYESMPGGTKMRSTFRLPAKTPGWFIKELRKHNKEEMEQFSVFLPALYADRDSSVTPTAD